MITYVQFIYTEHFLYCGWLFVSLVCICVQLWEDKFQTMHFFLGKKHLMTNFTGSIQFTFTWQTVCFKVNQMWHKTRPIW